MLKTLFCYARPFWPYLSASLLCRVVNQIGGILLLLVAAYQSQRLFAGETIVWWSELVMPLLLIGVVKAVCRYLEQLLGHNAAFSIQEDLRNQVYWQLEQRAPDNMRDLSSGEVTARVVADIERVEVFYAHTLVPVLSAVIVSVCVVFLMAQIQGVAMAIALTSLLALVGAVLPFWHLTKLYVRGAQLRHDFGVFNQSLTDAVNGLEEIQNWRCMHWFKTSLLEKSAKLQNAHQALAQQSGVKDVLTDGVIAMGFVLLAILWGTDQLSQPDDLALVLVLLAAAFGPVLALNRTFEDLPQTLPACRRVFELIEPSRSLPSYQSLHSSFEWELSSSLRLQGALKRYSVEGDPVLDIESLEFNQGQHWLITGMSGSGKTTLLKVLAAIEPLESGELLVNGDSIDSSNRDSWWSQLAYIPQKPVILPTSLRDNLCFGYAICDKQLVDVLNIVELTEFYAELEQGLDTPLGLNGARVSGGEAQRIALARALVRQPNVFVLDEAFSALDTQTERTLRDNLALYFENALILEVCHKSTIHRPHQTLTLKAGRIVKELESETVAC